MWFIKTHLCTCEITFFWDTYDLPGPLLLYDILFFINTHWVIPYYFIFCPMRKVRHSEFKPLTELMYYSGLTISDYMANSFLYRILWRTSALIFCEWRAPLNWLRYIRENSNSNNNCIYYLLSTYVVRSIMLAFLQK